MDKNLFEIAEKLYSNKPLSFEDGLILFNSNDLLSLGKLASEKANSLHEDKINFSINRHMSFSNICAITCNLCAFKRNKSDPDAYTYSVEKFVELAKQTPEEVTELHIVGGLNPDLKIEYFEQLFSSLKQSIQRLHIKALTAVELDFIAKTSNIPIKETITRLKKSGLDSMPGGGAEIFAPNIRKKIASLKMSGEEWLEVHKLAHSLGLKSNATMLFGHLESYEDRIDHMLQIRDLQSKTNGFQSFIPLVFLPENTPYEKKISKTSSFDILKTFAVSRLMMHNIPHIKCHWVMIGLPLAQASLFFGVNDLHGTSLEEEVFHAAGSKTSTNLQSEKLINLIKETGKIPVQRDTIYNTLKVFA